MTEFRPMAPLEAVQPQLTPTLRPLLLQGIAGLALGAGLTAISVIWSVAPLGLLSLLTVLGSLAWISIGVVRHYAARLRRA